MRVKTNSNDNHHLDDHDLLRREASERREYYRLRDRENHLGQTTYRVLNGSRNLMHAWARWTKTRLDTLLRGLKTHDEEK